MYKTQKTLFITISILLFLLGMIWGVSSLLDREAENILNNIYLKDDQGIIEGEGPIEVKRGGKEAFIFIHGFMAYPSGFKETIDVLKIIFLMWISMRLYCLIMEEVLKKLRSLIIG